MTCAAVSGVIATRVSAETHSISQQNRGMRIIVMPLQRMEMVVVMMLMAAPRVPHPVTNRLNAQKSTAWPCE